MTRGVCVRVPATSANLGPGFDCLALALDLWNEFTFILEGSGLQVGLRGRGADTLPAGPDNLAARAFQTFCRYAGCPMPDGLRLICDNQVPLSSGMGSSASAVLAGLLAARALLEQPTTDLEILRLAIEMEGHGDNAAAALLGGLTIISLDEDGQPLVRHIDIPTLQVAIVVPELHLPTSVSRATLPVSIPLKDAVFNLGHTALVVEALRSGDLNLLGKSMQDRLHQARRLQLIPGGIQALEQGLRSGASAVALSGAGPGLIAFTTTGAEKIAGALKVAVTQAGLRAEALTLTTTNLGASVTLLDQI